MKTGTASLPLHWGKAPSWLFQRMTRLAREILLIMVSDYGSAEIIRRMSDPFWFQALGCALGFDWHSSGLTTTVCGALKEAVRDSAGETGLFIAGGKGRASRKTPGEILERGADLAVDANALVYASRMSAKVDSAAVQDGYQLYHHVFFFNCSGNWAVVQQGLNYETRSARRYHWLADEKLDFACEPHAAVCCDSRARPLNLVAAEAGANRSTSALIAREHPDRLFNEVRNIAHLELPARHQVLKADVQSKRLYTILIKTYEQQPADFTSLLGLPGVGPKTLRSLALLSELIYGAPASYRDPARFSYAHGGKDGHPYPVNHAVYDQSIEILKQIISKTRADASEKKRAFRQLSCFAEDASQIE